MTHTPHARRAGCATPESGEALSRDESAQGFRGQETGSTAILPDGPDARKALATLAARCSLAGYELHELAGGELLLTRWGRSRSLADAHAVGRFLDMVTGVRS